MQAPHNTETLSLAILMLEKRRELYFDELKANLEFSYKSLQPVNLVKTGFRELVGSPEVKQGLFSSLVGLAGGFITKKMIIGPAAGMIRNSIGTVMQIIMTNLVSRKTATLIADDSETVNSNNKQS
ncbi:MAG: hypothetical protein B7Y15_03680 [Bacteroidetes bacterium 24-39-8]|jgi:hypothetical protein|nr:MAG: hypothetical protein B7Y15_03680 [Bacteroidetes bacterium 24-39-8]HQR94396.1 hypothetical protein [Sediminibacterium sp.]HQS54584.1 hypothetical protein [Sediminibacterium sp.]